MSAPSELYRILLSWSLLAPLDRIVLAATMAAAAAILITPFLPWSWAGDRIRHHALAYAALLGIIVFRDEVIEIYRAISRDIDPGTVLAAAATGIVVHLAIASAPGNGRNVTTLWRRKMLARPRSKVRLVHRRKEVGITEAYLHRKLRGMVMTDGAAENLISREQQRGWKKRADAIQAAIDRLASERGR